MSLKPTRSDAFWKYAIHAAQVEVPKLEGAYDFMFSETANIYLNWGGSLVDANAIIYGTGQNFEAFRKHWPVRRVDDSFYANGGQCLDKANGSSSLVGHGGHKIRFTLRNQCRRHADSGAFKTWARSAREVVKPKWGCGGALSQGRNFAESLPSRRLPKLVAVNWLAVTTDGYDRINAGSRASCFYYAKLVHCRIKRSLVDQEGSI
ncbi:hypothetical protein BX600DRAFT_529630 [Xylariales sp. PMI_506]|nr:hypothetical protein BX600DRAFT_529630 [Xylariales sp. PMI_506]